MDGIHGEIRTAVFYPHRLRSGEDGNVFSLKDLRDELAGPRLLRRQQPIRGFDDGDRGSEAGEPLRQPRPTAPPPTTVSEAGTSLASGLRDWSSRACRRAQQSEG
jgi:hypothetical protein